MRIPLTLSKYIGKQFLGSFAIILTTFMLITALFDILELSRRAHDKNIPFSVLIQMVLLKLPNLMLEMLPFVILIGGILAFGRLTRYSELIVARAAGISVWQFLSPAILLAFAIGIVVIIVLNPLSAIMLSHHEKLEEQYLKGNISTFSVSSTGLWLKQEGIDHKGRLIIHALRANFEEAKLYDVTFFMFDETHSLSRRLFAKEASLKNKYWDIKTGIDVTPGDPEKREDLRNFQIETTIEARQLQNSFSSPETVSFWSLPEFIETLKMAGFSATKHILHWHKVLVIPFFLSAMVFFAAIFSLRLPRKGRTGLLLAGGIIVGFIIRFLSDLAGAMSIAGNIPIFLAAWAPALISIFIGAAILLHLEDG